MNFAGLGVRGVPYHFREITDLKVRGSLELLRQRATATHRFLPAQGRGNPRLAEGPRGPCGYARRTGPRLSGKPVGRGARAAGGAPGDGREGAFRGP